MKIKPGKYKHYKGGEYEVLGIAIHSETLEELVVYRALYESAEFGKNTLWIRPLSIFIDKIKINGKIIQRFKYIKK